MVPEDLGWNTVARESCLQDPDRRLDQRGIEDAVTGDEPRRIIHERDQLAAATIDCDLLPVALPQAHRMIALKAYPLRSLS